MLTGYSGDVVGNLNKHCFQYNPQTNAWTTFLSLKFGHKYAAGTIYNSKLYIFDPDRQNSETFDLITQSQVETITTPASPGKGPCTVQLGDSVFVIGGESFTLVLLLFSTSWSREPKRERRNDLLPERRKFLVRLSQNKPF